MTDEIIDVETEDIDTAEELIAVTIILEQGGEEIIVRIPLAEAFSVEMTYPDPIAVDEVHYSADNPDEIVFDFKLPYRAEYQTLEHFKFAVENPHSDEHAHVMQSIKRTHNPHQDAVNLVYSILGEEDHDLRKAEHKQVVVQEAMRIVNALARYGYAIAKVEVEEPEVNLEDLVVVTGDQEADIVVVTKPPQIPSEIGFTSGTMEDGK